MKELVREAAEVIGKNDTLAGKNTQTTLPFVMFAVYFDLSS